MKSTFIVISVKCDIQLYRALVRLRDKSVEFHYTSELAPKRLLPPNYSEIEPLYINPTELYLFELSNDAGYIFMVNTDTQHRLHGINKSKAQVENIIQHCFGSALEWGDINIENYEFSTERTVL